MINKLNNFIINNPGIIGLVNGAITLTVAWFTQDWLPTLIVFVGLTGYTFMIASQHHDKKDTEKNSQ